VRARVPLFFSRSRALWNNGRVKVLLVGPRVAAVALVLSFGHGERPATATEAAKTTTSIERVAPPVSVVAEKEREAERLPLKGPVTPDVPKRSTLTPMGRQEAISFLAEAWQQSQGETPGDSTLAVLCAHWSHETDHGRRMHAYNFGGIKGVGPSGQSLVMWTREHVGEERLVRRTFRAYSSPEEGARDYVNLLAERYGAAFRGAREASIERFVTGLYSRGYFTDDEQTYLRSLARLVRECARDLSRAPQDPRR
jgi:flagellum-specific peptidoglycan hydrolase FlgJ